MERCPSCAGELSSSQRFCPSCGAPVGSASQMPTGMVGPPQAGAAQSPAMASPVGRLISSDSIPVGGFTPGMILADRYRIIGLLGRGGMGEVYRADDLKLGQPVALKFLPKELADDPVRRERFYAEVRIARQISHPNICRVYDVGELEGRHFLTMEFIDGEDLASLLKRIGHLHGAKALDVARQLCAGLAAAHDKGVLHRDLKPANVMLDGRGRVRVTDFGLAVAAGEELPAGEISGTPAYMAPEQLAGQGASVRSDIYALGLVLYEIYTGARAFVADSLAELRSKKEATSVVAPSEFVRDMDPVVERVILRCLERDPRQRPASVAHVAAALPGGDPLAAALAAGETPSPEMVAASGSTEGLRPWIAWTCLALVIVGISGFAILGRQNSLVQRVHLDRPPAVLEEVARQIIRRAGYSDQAADSAVGLTDHSALLQYIEEHDRSASRWDKLPESALRFWYRQSPASLEHKGPGSGVSWNDPAFQAPEEVRLRLDARGRLIELNVIPARKYMPGAAGQPADFSSLFQDAGLDLTRWTPAEPLHTPPVLADTQAAWTGVLADRPGMPMRVEAAADRGKPVFWSLRGPWDEAADSNAADPPLLVAFAVGLLVVLIAVLVMAMLFARRNLRMGRGDRRGAARLAYFSVIVSTIGFVAWEHHVATFGEVNLFFSKVGDALLAAGLLWILYVALEPWVRRRWPGVLVGWSRLLAGRFRDPLVGRDVLVGCAVNATANLLWFGTRSIAASTGVLQPRPWVGKLEVLLEARGFVAAVINGINQGLFAALGLLFLFLLLRLLLRRDWAAAALYLLFSAAYVYMQNNVGLNGWSLVVHTAADVAIVMAGLWLLLRFGLLAFAAALVFDQLLTTFPITPQVSAWYFETGLAGFAVLLGLAGYAFYASLGGQPMFGRMLAEDGK